MRILGVIVGALLLAVTAAAQTTTRPGGWIADERTGCQVWDPAPKPTKSVSWSGGCQNRIAQGRGFLQWFVNNRPTDRYEGDLVAGKYDGHGTYVSNDGFRYDGEWRDGMANGPGTLTTKNQATYSGTWTNGCFRDGAQRAFVGVPANSCP
jgi:hypothetical protein